MKTNVVHRKYVKTQMSKKKIKDTKYLNGGKSDDKIHFEMYNIYQMDGWLDREESVVWRYNVYV